MLTFVAKEKAFFANTFGRTTQVPSDAGESSDDEPIPKLEPLPRKKSSTKVTLSLVNVGLACVVLDLTDMLEDGQETDGGKDTATQVTHAPLTSGEEDKYQDQEREYQTAGCETD